MVSKRIRIGLLFVLAMVINLALGLALSFFLFIREYQGQALHHFADYLTSLSFLPTLLWGAGGGVGKAIHQVYMMPLPQLIFWGLIVLAALKVWLSDGMGYKEAHKDGSHGTARLQTRGEIRKHYQKDQIGYILGESNRHIAVQSIRNVLNLNPHALVFGGSGSAKTAGYVIPNILHIAETLGESQVILDPKGELWNRTSARLKELGYEVIAFNLLDDKKKRSARWNPMSGLKKDGEVLTPAAVELATVIYESTSSEREDRFFSASGKDLLTALILYVLEARPEREHHLRNVLHLCATIGKDQEALRGMFEELPERSQARAFFDSADTSAEKQWEGIRGDVKSRLGLWNMEEIADLTAASDFDPADLGRKKMALYLMIPDSDNTYNLIPALLIAQAFKMLIQQADLNRNAKLEVPVWFLLDELGNLPRIKELDAKVNTVRSREIRMMMIFQNIPQFQDKYGKEGSKSIDASCDTTIFLGTKESTTNKIFSEMVGETTIMIPSYSDNGQSKSGKNESYTGRPVMKLDEVRMIRKTNEVLVFQPGRHTARLKKCLYFKKDRWKDLPATHWQEIPKRKYEPLALCEVPKPKLPDDYMPE
ncbi:VirD4-like conjugal transfer protein, CD1115 family [Salinithrix halophila]|uniref:VirD4-like conjugal transfer protein, CD1115 family n=1 Tax=Salinithrix halophila TaxID=1485204 RepID=A0ABV8JGZ7_9BACL